MFTHALLCLFVLAMAEPNHAEDARKLPEDWPPLPDFKHTVDYVKWYEDRLNADVTDDAAPLWEELRPSNDNDPPEEKKARDQLWGVLDDGWTQGLFSGNHDEDPERWSWDPKDYPEWEKSYQLQRSHNLHARLLEAAKHKHLNYRLSWEHLDGEQSPFYPFSSEDRLVSTGLLPSLSTQRAAARVLLETAWRAPDGKPDPRTMVDAVFGTLAIARQLEQDESLPINLLVAMSIRGLAYHTLIHAIDEDVFEPVHIRAVDHRLLRGNHQPYDWRVLSAADIVYVAEILQFAYAPEEGEAWPQPPRLNQKNFHKLVESMEAGREWWPQDPSPTPLLEFATDIDRCGPREAVNQLIDLHLEIRRIGESELPQHAARKIDALIEKFKTDRSIHLLLREYHSASGMGIIICARHAALSRATRILYALHRVRNQTGEWPESLDDRRLMLRSETRVDPFTGKNFIYCVVNGEPMLYSAGYNEKDDGGKHKHWNDHWEEVDGTKVYLDVDYVFWPIPRSEE